MSFSAITVVAAGLLDGLNPCAFTTIVFFISFLAHVGKRKRELIITGLTFSLAVFATYLLIGLGLFKALFVLSGYRLFAEILYYGIIALLLVFAALSIHDCIVFSKTDQSKRILLQLPESFKRRIHDAIRKHAKGTNLVLGAVILGFVVTLFESVCTGQVYLPTIAFVLKHPDMRVNALFYLVLYNLMFILPLVVIFLLAYFGLKSDQLGKFFRGKVVMSKAALACLFVGLAVLLIWTH
jgi:cytochrome c biogenesis protein CcdA